MHRNKPSRILTSIRWLAIIPAGIWGFLSFDQLGDPSEIGRQSFIVSLLPYLFLLAVPLGLFMARKAFQTPQEDLEGLNGRLLQKKAQDRSSRRPSSNENAKQKALATLDRLVSAKVLDASEIATDKSLDLCRTYDIEDGDLYSVSNVLARYAEIHGDFAKVLFVADQIEVYDHDIAQMVKGFARICGQLRDLSHIHVPQANVSKGGANGIVTFDLAGSAQTIAFAYHNKHASGSLMQALSALFDPAPPYAVAYFDWAFLVTRLASDDRKRLNASLDSDVETFTLI